MPTTITIPTTNVRICFVPIFLRRGAASAAVPTAAIGCPSPVVSTNLQHRHHRRDGPDGEGDDAGDRGRREPDPVRAPPLDRDVGMRRRELAETTDQRAGVL